MSDPVLLIVLPLLGAFLLPLCARVSARLAWLAGPSVLALVAVIGLRLWVGLDAPLVVRIGGFAPPLGIDLYVDRLSLLFALALSLGALLLWPAGEGGRLRRATLILLLVAAGNGLALSGDLFNLFVFYELTGVVSFGLIASATTQPGDGAVFAATFRYLIVNALGAVLVLIGIALVYRLTGTLNLARLAQLAPERLAGAPGLAAFVAMLIGFGVKAELFPVNAWVPEIYATAPVRVSGLLAGVVSKLALLALVKLLVLVFDVPAARQLLLVLGFVGLLSGELAAWSARDYRRMLAFSSIGQLGAILIAFSVPGATGLFAGLALALHHLLLKPALFLLACRWHGALSGLEGAGRRSPWAAGLFILFALSIVGVPPLPGFWAKLVTLVALMAQEQPLYALGGVALLVGAVLEVNYLFRIVGRFWSREAGSPPAWHPRRAELWPVGLLGGMLLGSVWFIDPLAARLHDIAREAADVQGYIERTLPGASIPPMEAPR